MPKELRKKLIRKKIQDIKQFNTKKINGIFHFAAQSSVPLSLKNFHDSSVNNIESSLKIFELSKKFKAPIVYASSSAVYGNLPAGSDKHNKFSIKSPYAQDKLSIENYAKMSFEVFKTPSVGLRLFNVYGPGQKFNSSYGAVIPIFISRILKNKSVIINGGFQTRDFIYVEDVIEIFLRAMEKIQRQKSCKIFNLGTGRSVNINFLYKSIKENIGTNSKVIRKKLEKFDPRKSCGSHKSIIKFLKLKKYNFTKLEHGLQMTINYFL